MATDPDAPEWYDYASAWDDAARAKPPARDEVWNGRGWSERPTRAELAEIDPPATREDR